MKRRSCQRRPCGLHLSASPRRGYRSRRARLEERVILARVNAGSFSGLGRVLYGPQHGSAEGEARGTCSAQTWIMDPMVGFEFECELLTYYLIRPVQG